MFTHTIDKDTELRLLELRHAEELFHIADASRTYMRQWLPWVDATQSVDDTRAFIVRALEQFSRNQGFQAGIWHQGQAVGVVGYHAVNWLNRSTSLGYWLAEDVQGRGIMTRACKALIGHAFYELNLNRVEIRCATENFKSRAIPERLGFRHEGTLQDAEFLYDKFVDHEVYGMLLRQWAILHPPLSP